VIEVKYVQSREKGINFDLEYAKQKQKKVMLICQLKIVTAYRGRTEKGQIHAKLQLLMIDFDISKNLEHQISLKISSYG
jgi:hypothetical protein